MPSILLVSVLFIIGSYVYDSSVKNEVFEYDFNIIQCIIIVTFSLYHITIQACCILLEERLEMVIWLVGEHFLFQIIYQD